MTDGSTAVWERLVLSSAPETDNEVKCFADGVRAKNVPFKSTWRAGRAAGRPRATYKLYFISRRPEAAAELVSTH